MSIINGKKTFSKQGIPVVSKQTIDALYQVYAGKKWGIHLGRPKTAKKARFSWPEFGPRHQALISASVPVRFRDACLPELRYPGQPDSMSVHEAVLQGE